MPQILAFAGRPATRNVAAALTGAATIAFVATALCAAPAAAAPITPDSDPVLFWADVLNSSLTIPPPPPLSTRSIAMVNVAIYDAVNASLGNPNNSYLKVSTPGGDTRVAASVAAHDVLVNLFPAKTADFDAALSQQLAQVPDSPAKANGLITGGAIAAAMIAQRASDGFTNDVPYTPAPPGTPGRWQPTEGQTFVGKQLGQVDPWVIESGDQFRPAPPPALDSAEYAASFNQVKEVGSATSATRTADQEAAARYWATQTANPMLRLALALTEDRNLSTLENARIFALMSTVMADAVIGAWDAKLEYDFWRPATAIHDADLDGNPLTIADSEWQSLIPNPPYPGYTSGIMSVTGSGAVALQALLGNDFGFCLSSNNATPDRCWDNFDDMLTELTFSRIWAGIHFDFDMLAGLELNRDILQYALASDAFDAAVPEPAMIGLFGLGAAALLAAGRRRKGKPPTS